MTDDPQSFLDRVRSIAPKTVALAVNARDPASASQLSPWTGRGQTVCFLGSSGVGKSTLAVTLTGLNLATGAIREDDAKGRHTTTHRELHLLPGGGVLVDTPGIREVGIWTDTESVADAFADIDELAEHCRFRDCGHGSEPGCAVLAAVEDGTLAQDRLDAWRALDAEAASAELRADVVERRRKARQFGRIAREAQKAKEDQRER